MLMQIRKHISTPMARLSRGQFGSGDKLTDDQNLVKGIQLFQLFFPQRFVWSELADVSASVAPPTLLSGKGIFIGDFTCCNY